MKLRSRRSYFGTTAIAVIIVVGGTGCTELPAIGEFNHKYESRMPAKALAVAESGGRKWAGYISWGQPSVEIARAKALEGCKREALKYDVWANCAIRDSQSKPYLAKTDPRPTSPPLSPIARDPRAPPPSRTAPANRVYTGTCFAISPNGEVMTAHHVIKDAESILVKFADGRSAHAEIKTRSKSLDLAILRVNVDTPGFLSIAPMGSTHTGDQAFTLGYPVPGLLGAEPKFSEGSISSLSGLRGEAAFMQVTVPIQPGNSGGPLVNWNGEVVGVLTSSAAVAPFLRVTGTLPQNINWAVKGDVARAFVNSGASTNKARTRREAVRMVNAALCQVLASNDALPTPSEAAANINAQRPQEKKRESQFPQDSNCRYVGGIRRCD